MASSTVSAAARVAVVTGTNSGVGLSLSVKLAQAGYIVYAGMRGVTPEKRSKLDEASAAANVSENVKVLELDVCSDDSVAAAFNVVKSETGRVDVLVNNAGYSVFGAVEMLSMDTMKAQFETNFYGVIRCQLAALPFMRAQQSGKVINVSSVGGVWGQPFNDVYCASKFALEGLAESQAAVLRTFGVRVTNVQPGAIKSAFVANAKRPDMAGVPAENMPAIQSTLDAYKQSFGGGQTPDEVADAIMDQVVSVDEPPLKVQTNPDIQGVFNMQLGDTTGEAGVQAAASRFLKGL